MSIIVGIVKLTQYEMIKAIAFDLDGVFFKVGTEKFVETIVRNQNIAEEKFKDLYFRSEQMKLYKTGKITGSEYWDFVISELKLNITKEEILTMLIDSYKVDEAILRNLEILKANGYLLAVCTNNFKERLEPLIEKFKMREYFDVILPSYEFGVVKPNREIFEELRKRLNMEYSEIVMSDDKQSNVGSLKEIGFNSYLYENWDGFKKYLISLGVKLD